MKKTILPVLFLICSIHIAVAQKASFGLRAGLNLSTIGGEGVEKMKADFAQSYDFMDVSASSDIQFSYKSGYHLGGYFNLGFRKISVEPGIYFSTKGYEMDYDLKLSSGFFSISGGSIKERFNASYLDFPLLMRYEMVKGLSLFAGPQFSVLINSRSETSGSLFGLLGQQSSSRNTNSMNNMDLSANFGAGYQLPFGLNFNVGYDLGLKHIYEESENNNPPAVSNRVIKMSIGYVFK